MPTTGLCRVIGNRFFSLLALPSYIGSTVFRRGIIRSSLRTDNRVRKEKIDAERVLQTGRFPQSVYKATRCTRISIRLRPRWSRRPTRRRRCDRSFCGSSNWVGGCKKSSSQLKRAQLLVTALRSFLRFLLREAKIQVDLAACVPTVADWRLSSVPKFLTEEEVRRLLDGCERTTATGRRDYAVLVLLARLGLRTGEVVALEIDDIDWRAGEVMIRGKGRVHERLPLLTEPGEALATDLRRDRPGSRSRRVFVRMKAPHSGFAGPSTVSTIVRRALERAGLHPPAKGAHILRHTLATGMLRGGASMSEIGQVLRHRSPHTTEIYAKVDLSGLRSLAQPWPHMGGGR
jgi:site-specific recombinase XerD